jgi:tetratricopeptide (TPR) repeat protein
MSEQKQTLTIQKAIDLGVQHHKAGRLPQAESIYQQILQAVPNQPAALHLLGVIAHQVGENDTAVDLITKALAVKPDYAEAHCNLGATLQELGKLDEAVASYHKALAVKPDYAKAHCNLGNALKDLGKLDEAVASYRKALAIKPDYAKAHNNLGNALQEFGKLEEAVASYHKALGLKPDSPEMHNNLGNALQSLGKLDEAVASYHKALPIKPDYVETHNNLGNALQNLGKLDEAVASYRKALAIKPDYAEAWNNLMFAAKALQFSKGDGDRAADAGTKGLNDAARATVNYAIHQYYQAKFRPHEADKAVQKALAALPPKVDEEVHIDGSDHKPATPPALADKVIGMLNLGRSGSGLLHSLVDSHPEVSTLPSIYLRGFFNAGVWNKISADGWRRLPERFADEFAVLFDANSPRSTPGVIGENSFLLGRMEGMTTVGEDRNESLSLDRDQFCAEALRLMETFTKVDPALFLLVVHAAFEKVLGTKTKKHTVFYHIHNPNDFSKLNFLRYAPDARLLMMVREPVQSCESWIRNPFGNNDYNKVILRIISMLFAIDQIAFRMRDSVGVRLEDLKTKPEATLRSLCTWMGVEDSPTLYQMTAQGKKWWGDPSSPDYDTNKAMNPFDRTSIQRSVGSIFSEQDQFVLGTLFYPFSVRFGYREADSVAFEKDLKEIRPLLDELLDFERVISERCKIVPDQFKRGGLSLLLHAGLMDRWDVLNKFKDYPHLLSPLKITVD